MWCVKKARCLSHVSAPLGTKKLNGRNKPHINANMHARGRSVSDIVAQLLRVWMWLLPGIGSLSVQEY